MCVMGGSARARVLPFLAVLLATLEIAHPASAATAVGRSRSIACERRAGAVWLENRLVRIYSHRGRVYACSRRSAASVFLFHANTSGSRRVQLAGGFVAWKQETASGVQRIAILNVRKGTIRRVGSLLTSGHMIGPGIADLVADSDGTVIWLDDVGSQEGPFSSFSSTLYESSGRGSFIFDHATSSTPIFPISSFGLSSNGHIVYWTDDGDLNSAPVS